LGFITVRLPWIFQAACYGIGSATMTNMTESLADKMLRFNG
jgi:hypothetical protein